MISLWILAILTILAVGIGHRVSMGLRLARYQKDKLKGLYLAKAGLKVLIVEKNDKPGGCCVSFKRNGIRFDAGVHVIGSCNKNGVLYRILKNLGIKQEFVRLNPTDRFFFGEDKIEVPNEINKYAAYLQQHFPNEKSKISNFFEELI